MSAVVNSRDTITQEQSKTKLKEREQSKGSSEGTSPITDGVVYSRQKSICPFSTPPLEAYVPIIGEERTERLQKAAQQLQGLKLLELNATAQGGGVAEMLYSSIPFLDTLGIETEWKVIRT
ncbi:unnamed protein product [marine sediment metagenome]|uniref:Trehalose synthase N-terminal domain-containing protein n=1 Tax=marine sediment metagenome TaxID=412755 RepID=X1M0H1_9ZZZZ